MATAQTAGERITEEVTSWPGVEAGPGRRGEFAFTVGRKEIGHLHGDRVFHGGFPKEVWHELYDQGRIDYHPVFPGKPGYASRAIDSASDVDDVIALIRLNYDRAVARHGLPDSGDAIPRLFATSPEPLPFAPSLHIRAFLLERPHGNLLIYSTKGLEQHTAAIEQRGGIARQYLNHGHEAMFSSAWVTAPLYVHEADAPSVDEVGGTFSTRHMVDDDFEVIPTPGHTPGATAYLWNSSSHRMLFTGDTIYLDEGEWVAAPLASSDRESYVKSLELIRELNFDVLVPWAATADEPFFAMTDRADTRRRIDAILERLRAEGADR
jgi:hypothetical protein